MFSNLKADRLNNNEETIILTYLPTPNTMILPSVDMIGETVALAMLNYSL